MKKKVRYLVGQDTSHGKVKMGDELSVDSEVADLEVKRGIAEYVPVPTTNYDEKMQKAYMEGKIVEVDKETHEALLKDNKAFIPAFTTSGKDKKDSTTKEVESKSVKKRKKYQRKKYSFDKS